MARSEREMADRLVTMYSENQKRYRLSHDAFKRIAGKARLRDAFLNEVDIALREDGYVLVDLREEYGFIAVAKQSIAMKYDDLSSSIDDHIYAEDEQDEE